MDPWYLKPEEYTDAMLKRHGQLMLRSVRNHGFEERKAIVQATPHDVFLRGAHQFPQQMLCRQKILCSELVQFRRYLRRVLYGKLVVEPCYLTSIVTLLKDQDDRVLQLRIAPFRFRNCALGLDLDMSIYQKDSVVSIRDPFFVRFLDGTVGLRIANPREMGHPLRTANPWGIPTFELSTEAHGHVQPPYPDHQPGANPKPVKKLHIGGILAFRRDQRVAAPTDRRC